MGGPGGGAGGSGRLPGGHHPPPAAEAAGLQAQSLGGRHGDLQDSAGTGQVSLFNVLQRQSM